MTLGHTSVADLKTAYFPPSNEDEEAVNGRKVNGTKTNGAVNGDGDAPKLNGSHADRDDESLTSPEELYAIVQNLMEHGWIMQVAEAQYLSAEDMHNIARQQALNDRWGGAVPTGTKDKDMLAHLIMENKRRIRDTWLELPQFSSRKRKADDSDFGSNKRTKLNGAGQYGSVGSSESSPEDDLVIRVNPEKVAVAMRNQYLVSLVENRVSHTSAQLFEILLRSFEKDVPRCFEDHPDPPPRNIEDKQETERDPKTVVNTKDVAQRAKILGINICNGLDPHFIASIVKDTRVGKDGVLSPPVDPASLGFHERVAIIEAHFNLLKSHPLRITDWACRGQFRVDYDKIASDLIQEEVENTVLARKGKTAMKLIRALKKKGKLDERQLCNTMMQSANDIRNIVNELTVQGFIQTQEIPKVDRREAKLSVHLIWYDVQRAREKLLHDTYKGQVRILQRIAFEREKIQELLSKASRTDVAGNETKYLKQEELDALKKWKEVQEKLLLQLSREDDLVAVLRDYCGPLTTA